VRSHPRDEPFSSSTGFADPPFQRTGTACRAVFLCFLCFLFPCFSFLFSQEVSIVVLAFPPPDLPTGSKAEVSFETTGALNARPSPFGDLASSELAITLTLGFSAEITDN
jgi:hypothetical protein